METKLWHDIKEKPAKSGDILFTDNDTTKVMYYCNIGFVQDNRDRYIDWEDEVKYWKRWCYVEDILRIE